MKQLFQQYPEAKTLNSVTALLWAEYSQDPSRTDPLSRIEDAEGLFFRLMGILYDQYAEGYIQGGLDYTDMNDPIILGDEWLLPIESAFKKIEQNPFLMRLE